MVHVFMYVKCFMFDVHHLKKLSCTVIIPQYYNRDKDSKATTLKYSVGNN